MKKNILFYRYNSIYEPPVISALKKEGCCVDEITDEISNKNIGSKECLLSVNGKPSVKSYDAVFTINFYPAISEICKIYNIPYICWTVDCPIMELYSHSISNSCNRIFLFDYAQYQEFLPHNPDNIYYLPLGANTSHYDHIINNSLNPEGSDIPGSNTFGGDITFVGSLYSEKCSYNDCITKLPDKLRGYFDGIMNAQLKVYGYNFLPEVITDEMALEYSKYGSLYSFPELSYHNYSAALAHNVLAYKIAETERIDLLSKLSEKYSVTLYTRSDTSMLPKINCPGSIDTLTEMPQTFHFSKINLNFTIKSIQTGLPMRIWDILGCGGFLLTNFQHEIPQYFEIGTDLDTFGSTEELLEKTGYYLTHEEERAAIAQNGYEKVKKFHTVEMRIRKILDIVF